LISGALQVFLTPERVTRLLPKNKLASITVGCGLGVFFPSCECGIVPIVNRLLEKKVPQYTAIPFLVTAPVINPIVLFATYTAFGNSILFATYRALGAILVSVVLGIILGFFVKNPILKEYKLSHHQHDYSNKTSL